MIDETKKIYSIIQWKKSVRALLWYELKGIFQVQAVLKKGLFPVFKKKKNEGLVRGHCVARNRVRKTSIVFWLGFQRTPSDVTDRFFVSFKIQKGAF